MLIEICFYYNIIICSVHKLRSLVNIVEHNWTSFFGGCLLQKWPVLCGKTIIVNISYFKLDVRDPE